MKDESLTNIMIVGGIGIGALALLAKRQGLLGLRLTNLAETQVAAIGFTIAVPSLAGEFSNIYTPPTWVVGQGFGVGQLATGTYLNTSNFAANFRARIIDMDKLAPNNIICQQEQLVWLEPGLSTNFVLPGALFGGVMPNKNWNLMLELLMYT